MKKAVIFDLDGTLLNTLEDLCDSTNYAMRKCGFPERQLDEIRRFVGNGVHKLIERSAPPGTDAAQREICYRLFCEYYKQNMENKTREYSGISDMLAALYEAGYQLAIVTNKADFAAQALCGKLFGKYVKTVIGSVPSRPNKPAPDGVYAALDAMHVTRDEAVYIGDSEVDVQTAQNACVDMIGVLWGFRNRDDLQKAGANVTVSDAQELKNRLLALKNC